LDALLRATQLHFAINFVNAQSFLSVTQSGNRIMNKLSLLLSAFAGAGAVLVSSSLCAANAATLGSSFAILDEFTGDNAQVSVNLVDVAGGVQFTVDIVRPPTVNGDLFGLFGSVLNDNISAITSITGANVTGSQVGPANSVINLGGGNNLNGFQGNRFDFGVNFNGSGLAGGPLLSNTVFTVAGLSTADFANQVLGARLQSTGANQGGSSKLSGLVGGGAVVPEPITMLGTGAAIAFGAAFRRRQQANPEA
jgi:hypothetical protein